jgi:hypothetical protein
MVAVLLVIAVAVSAAPALAASTPPKATPVSYATVRRDFAAGRARDAEINRVAHSIVLVLTDGRRERALYPSHEEKRLVAELRAKHVAVVFRHSKHHKRGKGGHPLRIAAAIIAVLAAGSAVFLLARRRRPPSQGLSRAAGA